MLVSHDFTAIVLAAGQGTRMRSDTAKVLHCVAGRPLVAWPIELARTMGARRIVVVLGHKADAVRAFLQRRYGEEGMPAIVLQEPQLGTGDAVRKALSALEDQPGSSRTLVLYGDVPLLSRETAARLLDSQGASCLALVSSRPPSPAGYGRLVRDAQGRLTSIVEEKDAPENVRAIEEVNAGIYAITLGFLRESIGRLVANNAQGELYLTDLVSLASQAGEDTPVVEAPFDEVAGVNDRVELARLDAVARRQIAVRWMKSGVTICDPGSTHIDVDVNAIGRDTEIGAMVSLRGSTSIGARVRIDVGSVLADSEVADDVVIKPYCVITESHVGLRAQVGPFAHCRPGTHLGDDVHLGNFVESKKAHLGAGSKANHLTYLGDVEIGPRVNVGAGTITCNYDGIAKHRTVIEEGVFIGSDTQLVAPVKVGKGAYVGAGTTVTQDVPAGSLALSRVRQTNIEGYVERKKRKQSS
ncbi:MAG: bifunctional UDP-N-acetylglucosamine diphosphorylase/glucosamine-1-phosphate N-acetyltransferase GlmU [Pseudomonadota bacterium]